MAQVAVKSDGLCDTDLFVQHVNGGRISDRCLFTPYSSVLAIPMRTAPGQVAYLHVDGGRISDRCLVSPHPSAFVIFQTMSVGSLQGRSLSPCFSLLWNSCGSSVSQRGHGCSMCLQSSTITAAAVVLIKDFTLQGRF